jgi:hypothetical protein
VLTDADKKVLENHMKILKKSLGSSSQKYFDSAEIVLTNIYKELLRKEAQQKKEIEGAINTFTDEEIEDMVVNSLKENALAEQEIEDMVVDSEVQNFLTESQ